MDYLDEKATINEIKNSIVNTTFMMNTIPVSYVEKVENVINEYNKYELIYAYDWFLDKNPATQYVEREYRSTDQYLKIDKYTDEVKFTWKRGKGESGIVNKYTIVYQGTGKVKGNQYQLEIIYDDDEPKNVGKKFWVKIDKIKVDYQYYDKYKKDFVKEKVDEYKISVVDKKDKKYFYTSYDHIENRRYNERKEYSSYPWPADVEVIMHESNNHHYNSSNNDTEDEWMDFDEFYEDTWGDYEDEDEAYEEWDMLYN